MVSLTLLEKYQKLFIDIASPEVSMGLEHAWVYQELLYRMEVLQVCQMFTATAPVGDSMKAMLMHYQMVDGYFESLRGERHIGKTTDEKEQKQRDTAIQNLYRVIMDYRKRFSSFSPGSDERYKKEITKAITTVLPAWIQVRNAYITIHTKEEAA